MFLYFDFYKNKNKKLSVLFCVKMGSKFFSCNDFSTNYVNVIHFAVYYISNQVVNNIQN